MQAGRILMKLYAVAAPSHPHARGGRRSV